MFETFPRRFSLRGRGAARALPVATLLATALLATTALAGPQWKGTQETVDGKTLVKNPAEGIDAPMSITLDETFRLGGWDGGEDEFFGVISDILEDEQGNLYVLDAQLNDVKIYDAEGAYVSTIGREGEGPGEFRGASSLFWLPNGDLGVLQAFPPKIVTLTRDGAPGADFAVQQPEGQGFMVLQNASRAGDNLAVLYSFRFFNRETQEFTATTILGLFDPSGKEFARLHTHVGGGNFGADPVISEQQFDNFGSRWAAAPDGRIVATDNLEDYRLLVWQPNGTFDRTIERAYPAHVRTDAEREELLEIYRGFTRNQPLPPNTRYEVNKNHPAVDRQGVYVRPDGSIWVLSSRGSDENDDTTLGTFDVYDPKGRFVRQVTLRGQCDNNNDLIMFVGDRIFVITEFLGAAMSLQGGGGEGAEDTEDAEPMQLICYRSSQLDAAAGIPAGAVPDSR